METLKNIEYILQTNTICFSIFFFIIGICLASFFNVVILRIPQMIEQQNAEEVKAWFEEKNIPFPSQLEPLLKHFNLSYPSSHCYQCKTPLKWYHNIPIFSYLFLKGKCGFCSHPISMQYPIVEFIGGIILLASYLIFIPQGLSVFVLASVFLMICFVLIAIDFKAFLLPDNLTLSLLWIGLITCTLGVKIYPINVIDSIHGIIAGYLSLLFIATVGKFIKKQDVMGQGDFKLLAALGAFIGLKGAIFTALFAPFVGIFTWLWFKCRGKSTDMIPYGPSLIIASIFYIFYGREFLIYFNIFI